MGKVKELFQTWLRCPDDASRRAAGFSADCLTMSDFAKKYGVNRSTLYRWQQNEQFRRETVAPIQELVTPDDIVVSIRAQVEKARNGNTGAFNALVKLYGLDLKQKEDEVEDEDDSDALKGMSKEELQAYLATFTKDELGGEA